MDTFILSSLPHSYISLAKESLTKGELEIASSFYFKAAESALDIYKKTYDSKDQEYWKDFIVHCIYLGRKYKPIKEKEEILSKDYSKITESQIPTLTFDNVAGLYNVKKDIEKKIIWPITDPEGYKKFVGSGCRGVIMYGPPGCGKTLLAKAAAGEAKNATFYKVDQSDIKNMYVGKSEQKMKELFKKAAENQPAIIFFDEVDSLAGTRNKDSSVYNRDLANEFKSDFDEIKDKTILVIGATNHPWNIDSAFIRPGRFEEFIFIPPPDLEARAEIFRLNSRERELDNEIDFNRLASLTRGYSGADLEKICKDAGALAYERYRNNEDSRITYLDFLKAIENTKPSLKQWCSEVKSQMLDGRYPNQRVLKKGISKEFEVILDLVDQLEKL